MMPRPAFSAHRFFAALMVFALAASIFAGPAAAEEKPRPKPKPAVPGEAPMLDPYSKAAPEVEVLADHIEYAKTEKKMVAKGNVIITYGPTKLTADYAEVYTETKEAHARGHVLIFEDGIMVGEGNEVYFNFKKASGSFPDGRHFETPWFVMGDEMKQIKKGHVEITNAVITTCDYEDLHYEIRASKATIRKGDKLVAHNVRIYMLKKPIFWTPILVIPLHRTSLPFSISFGRNDRDGWFIETTKGIAISKHMEGKLLIDWRSKRGFGAGGILDYNFGKLARGNIIGYRTQDKSAPAVGQTTVSDNPFAEDVEQDRDRGRFTWRHRADFDDKLTFMVARYHGATDEFVLQDFFEKEHRSEVEQQSFVTFTKNTENWGVLGHFQRRVNDFESLVERLPEIRFDLKNQPFLHPNLYYENQMSLSNMTIRHGRSPMRQDVFRMDNFHEWSLPLKWNEIKFTPYANMRGTYYSRDRRSDDKFRFSAGYGFDMRTHFYKTYDVTSDFMGIEVNQLRHVLEPSFQFDSIRINNVSDETIVQFDQIDAIDDRDVFTFGLENRFQTKRMVGGKMKRVDIVSLNTYLNYAVKPDEPSSASHFKILSQEVVLRPYQWLRFETRFNFNIEDGELESYNADLIAKKDKFRILIGHRYVKDPNEVQQVFDAERIDTSHQFVFEGSYELNKLWSFAGHLRYDPQEQELEEWEVTATRDLHDFILSFGYNVRNSSIRSSNKEFFFNFTMKQFPILSIRSGSGRGTFSEPRIGETVAGANQYGAASGYFDETYGPAAPPTP